MNYINTGYPNHCLIFCHNINALREMPQQLSADICLCVNKAELPEKTESSCLICETMLTHYYPKIIWSQYIKMAFKLHNILYNKRLTKII